METNPSPRKLERIKGYKIKRKRSGPGKGLTVNERKLADLVAKGTSPREAAFEAYNPSNPTSASAIACEILAKPDVRAYLESVAGEAAEIVMKHARYGKSEMVSLVAAKDVLDRTGFKTPEPSKDPNQGATYNFIFSEQTRGEVAEIEARIRARLTGINNDEEIEEVMETEQEGPG